MSDYNKHHEGIKIRVRVVKKVFPVSSDGFDQRGEMAQWIMTRTNKVSSDLHTHIHTYVIHAYIRTYMHAIIQTDIYTHIHTLEHVCVYVYILISEIHIGL